MIRIFKRHAAAFVASFLVSLPAAATNFGTDYTDLWWNPNESGWGVNVIQQWDTIFATLFVYDQTGSARWFVASNLTGSQNTFSGTLYQTTGPYFGGPFNPAGVHAPAVGTMTFAFNGDTGTLTYSVNGVTVTKSIQRQGFKTDNLTGHYLGGLTANGTGCSGVTNGPILIFDTLTVSQSGQSLSMRVDFFNRSGQQSACTFNGILSPAGRQSNVTSGTFSCVSGGAASNAGSFTITSITSGPTGFSGSFSGRDQFCSYSGQFGGVKDVI